MGIFETAHWYVGLRPKQTTLGAAVFILKTHVATLADVTPPQLADLGNVFARYESQVRKKFAAEKFNYVVAMMKDAHVHFHAFPRYSHPIEFGGEKWTDDAWPEVVQFTSPSVSADQLKAIQGQLKLESPPP